MSRTKQKHAAYDARREHHQDRRVGQIEAHRRAHRTHDGGAIRLSEVARRLPRFHYSGTSRGSSSVTATADATPTTGEREVRQCVTQMRRLLAHDAMGMAKYDKIHEQRADLVDVRIEETGQHEALDNEPDRPTCAQLPAGSARLCEAAATLAPWNRSIQRTDEPVVKAQQKATVPPTPRHAVGKVAENQRTELTMSLVKPSFTDDSPRFMHEQRWRIRRESLGVAHRSMEGYSDRLKIW